MTRAISAELRARPLLQLLLRLHQPRLGAFAPLLRRLAAALRGLAPGKSFARTEAVFGTQRLPTPRQLEVKPSPFVLEVPLLEPNPSITQIEVSRHCVAGPNQTRTPNTRTNLLQMCGSCLFVVGLKLHFARAPGAGGLQHSACGPGPHVSPRGRLALALGEMEKTEKTGASMVSVVDNHFPLLAQTPESPILFWNSQF